MDCPPYSMVFLSSYYPLFFHVPTSPRETNSRADAHSILGIHHDGSSRSSHKKTKLPTFLYWQLKEKQEQSLRSVYAEVNEWEVFLDTKIAGTGTEIPMSAWYVLMFPADLKSGRDDALLIIEWKSGLGKVPPWYRQILPIRTFGRPEYNKCSMFELSSRSIGGPRGGINDPTHEATPKHKKSQTLSHTR